MLTYQDYLAADDMTRFVQTAIAQHRASEVYRTAVIADLYNAQKNVTATEVSSMLKSLAASGVASARVDMAMPSNYFARFNTQRCAYLLGNGVSFTQTEKRKNAAGVLIDVDVVKERLGQDYDMALYQWAYNALIHGVCYEYYDGERPFVFPVTEFAALPDEDTGEPRAGVRFWRIDKDHPMRAELYTEEGVYEFRSDTRTGETLRLLKENPRPYAVRTRTTRAAGTRIVGAAPVKGFPVVPMYGNELHQSTLVGFRQKIDAWDLIAGGLCKDEREVAAIYWIVHNQNGMTQAELNKVLSDLLDYKIINVDGSGFDGSVREAMTPYSTEVPHQGRLATLDYLEKSMYKDFGAVDVHTIQAGATNDHIDAAFRPLDEEADRLEAQVIIAIRKQLALLGIDDTPQFDRGKLQNITELTNAIMQAANYLGPEAVLDLLPFVTVDMKAAILQRLDSLDMERLNGGGNTQTPALTGGEM